MIDDKKFKELLNLHLDHRLSAEEAALLERALAADPQRRRTFQSYAAMQRGCAELFRRSSLDAPAPDALVQALRQAESRMGRRSAPVVGWRTWSVPLGLAAAVALVVARISLPTTAVKIAAVSETATPLVQPVVAPAAVLLAEAATMRPPVRLTEHLTMAAQGISQERASVGGFSRWSDTVAVVSEESGPALGASWEPEVSAATLSDWNHAASTPRAFSSRPINAWSGQSGYQVQAATYTFER